MDIRDNDLLDLEIAYSHNPDVLGLVRTVREMRDDIADAVEVLEDTNLSFEESVNESLRCLGSETRFDPPIDEETSAPITPSAAVPDIDDVPDRAEAMFPG